MKLARNRAIHAELDKLIGLGILDAPQANRIRVEYPTLPWDLRVLARWFAIFGAVSTATGLVILAQEFVNGLRLGEFALAVLFGALLWGARWLREGRGLLKTAAGLELGAGFAVQGLITLLAIDFSTGSDNWPALVGVHAAVLLGLAYVLANRLVLVHASVCSLVFLGAESGYASGWGMYYLGLTYPMRFLAIGVLVLGLAWLHATRVPPRWQGFARVYGHVGMLVLNLVWWFFSTFGYFAEQPHFSENQGERLAFSVIWAAFCGGSLWLAARLGQRMLAAYGLTFLTINVYTFYFQFVAANSPEYWFVHLLVVGSSLVWLGFRRERLSRVR